MDNYYRPILKIRKSKSEWVWDMIGGGLFIGAIVYLVISWSLIPDQVPGHYNGAGEVNRWGSKYELFILPIVGLFLWILLGVLERFPHAHNYPARLNESNVEAFYKNSRKLLNSLKNICLITFAYIMIQSIRVAVGDSQSLGLWFLPVFLLAIAIPIIRGIILNAKIK